MPKLPKMPKVPKIAVRLWRTYFILQRWSEMTPSFQALGKYLIHLIAVITVWSKYPSI
jgi:hypothetical protein